MKLFSQLLKKEPVKAREPESLDSKLAKLAGKSQSELVELIHKHDESKEDLELRLALVMQLSYGPELANLACRGSTAGIEKQARRRIAQLFDEGSLNGDTILSDIHDLDSRLAIASFAKDDGLHEKFLAAIEDQSVLADLCASSTSAKVRQALAARIEDPDSLRKLSKQLKNKDKNAYKTIKSKLDLLRAEEHRHAAAKKERDVVISEMNSHAGRQFDREYEQRYARLLERWHAVDSNATEDEKDKFALSRAVCEKKITDVKAEIEAAEALQTQINQVQNKRQAVLDQFWSLINDILALPTSDEEKLTRISERLDAISGDWAELKQLKKPEPLEQKDHTLMADAVASLLLAYKNGETLIEISARLNKGQTADSTEDVKKLKRLIYPTQALKHYPTSEPLANAIATIERLGASFAKRKEDIEKQLKIVGGLIRRVHRAVDEGHLKQAIGIRHSIDEKLDTLDVIPTHVARQLETLDEAVQKLVDWQAYAVVPKKENLIVEMEKLVGCEIPPEALATKIKNLQEQWKALSQSGKDRGEALWQQFSELADKAYEPCKVYYQELSTLRKQNLEKRKNLVQQLRDFYNQYDWDKADWKHVEKIMRTARGELHSYSPVERSANKPVLEQFEAAVDKLHAKINEEFENNKATKKQLIMQAEKAVDIADIQQATGTVKRLQAQWKKVGHCQYRENEALWKEFRQHCDKVFERKDQKINEERAETDAKIASARSFVDKLQELANKNGNEILSARSERDELQHGFANTGELPEKVHKAIQRDFNKAADEFDKKVEKALNEHDQQAWRYFFEACEKINAYRSGGDVSQEDVESFIAQVEYWPEGGAAVIKESMSAPPVPGELEERLRALKLLCIRAEIRADKETPEEDRALRMEHQVALLQKGLRAQHQTESAAIIAKEWARATSVPDEQYQRLFSRFHMSWSAIKAS